VTIRKLSRPRVAPVIGSPGDTGSPGRGKMPFDVSRHASGRNAPAPGQEATRTTRGGNGDDLRGGGTPSDGRAEDGLRELARQVNYDPGYLSKVVNGVDTHLKLALAQLS
jgi:hypothetical protein